ncbi:MAG: response regulator, partial [Acidimicrobiales bacterium]
MGAISVYLADDNLLVRAGVRALLDREPDVEVVGEAASFDELLAGACELAPNVVVSDIRMPPAFQREGIDAAKEIRKRHPGTGVVILSQHDDPEYAVSLLSDGAAGYAYLLKDRVAEGDQLTNAVRAVAAGGTVVDPVIVEALVRPVRSDDRQLDAADEELLTFVAEGRSIKAIAVLRQTTPEDVADDVERLFLRLAQGA